MPCHCLLDFKLHFLLLQCFGQIHDKSEVDLEEESIIYIKEDGGLKLLGQQILFCILSQLPRLQTNLVPLLCFGNIKLKNQDTIIIIEVCSF